MDFPQFCAKIYFVEKHITGVKNLNEAVTFLVKATTDRNKIIRCLNSIYRQTVSNFKVVAFCSVEGIIPELKETYPGIRIVPMKNAKAYVNKLNEEFANLDTEYCTFVNFDEVVAPNATELILSKKADAVIFNIAKRNPKYKFAPRYPVDSQLNFVDYVKKGMLIWNGAVRSDIIKDNMIKLQDFCPALQLLFMLECYSWADNIAIDNNVIAYRDGFKEKELPNYNQFAQNCKRIGKIIKRFEKKGMLDVKEQIVTDFVVSQLKDYYNEKSFLRRMKKRYLLRKYMGL